MANFSRRLLNLMLRLLGTFGLLLFLGTVQIAMSKPWEGITPLHSSARDVARFSEECRNETTRCQFVFKNSEVMVVFSGSKIGDAECVKIPKQTVLAIIVKFDKPKKLETVKLKNKHFTEFDPSYPAGRGYKTLYYSRDGFMINTYNGEAIGLVYIAVQTDVHLCPEYYEDPKGFVELGLVP